MPAWYHWDGDVLVLQVHAQPRARHDEIVGPHGDALKIRITAPPVDGKANRHLLDFLARTFGVARSEVQLAGGAAGRRKRFRIRRPAKLITGIAPPEK